MNPVIIAVVCLMCVTGVLPHKKDTKENCFEQMMKKFENEINNDEKEEYKAKLLANCDTTADSDTTADNGDKTAAVDEVIDNVVEVIDDNSDTTADNGDTTADNGDNTAAVDDVIDNVVDVIDDNSDTTADNGENTADNGDNTAAVDDVIDNVVDVIDDNDKEGSKESRPSNVYCPRPKSDCFGHDIRHVRVSDKVECFRACDEEPTCLSVQQWGTTCWLKHYVCRNSELNRSHIGNDYIKRGPGSTCEAFQHDNSYCHRPNSDCYGHDIRRVPVDSLEQCQAACDEESDCRSIQQWGTVCWLKHHVCDSEELTSSSMGHDYFKLGPNQQCPRRRFDHDDEN